MELTPRQIKTLERFKKVAAADVVGRGNLAMIDYMVELEEQVDQAVDEAKALYPDLMRALEDMKGEKGDDADNEYIIEELTKRIPQPEKIDKEELARLVLAKIRIPKDGDNGKVDYDLAVAEVLKRIPLPENGKDGSPDSSEDIRNKLELLTGDERLSAEFISGLDIREEAVLNRAIEILDKRTQYLINKQSGGAVSSLTTTGTSGPATLTNGVLNIPQYTGGSTAIEKAGGLTNGSNTAFTVTVRPVYMLGDSMARYETVDYTVSGLNITWTNADNIPTNSLYSVHN